MANNGPVNKIGFDVGGAESALTRLINKIEVLNGKMKALAVAGANYNSKGQITSANLRGLTDAGTQMDVYVKKVKGGYEIITRTAKQSIDSILREEARLTKERAAQAQAAKNQANTATFRQKLGGFSRSEIPTNATQVDQRFFINAQRDLEKFVSAGDISAKRAATILDNIKSGVKGRLQGIEEDFRVAALRMFAAAQRVRQQFNDAVTKQQAVVNAQGVRPYLDTILGKINSSATPAGIGRVENLFNRLAASVESTSVPLTRFQDLVTKTLGGISDPANKAERAVVRMVQSLVGEYDKANQAAQKLADAQKRLSDAGAAKSFITGQLGNLNRLSSADQERVQAQIARIQNLMTRANNPLSTSSMRAAVGAGLKGQTNGFQGVEEQARKSAARIRQIIQGQLKDPFNIQLALDRHSGLIRNLYTGRFLIDLVQDFHQTVDAAAEFQRSIALIQTITDDVKVPFDKWADSIRKVSDELGKPIAEVAAAGYDVLSNQVTKNVEDTMSVLRSAGQFARVTNSSTEDSINLLSSAINTFKMSAGDSERVAAQFFKTIDLGRVKTGEMANTIGRSAVYAKTLGVSLEELQAGIITITQTGQKADSSFTLLNNVFQKLLNPTKELQSLYDKLGVGTGEIFVQTYGFTGALQKLAEVTGGSTAKLADYFNEIRAFGGIDALISRSKVFEGALKELGDSTNALDKAKDKFNELPGQRFQEEMNKIKNLFLTTFQTGLLKTVLGLTDGFGGLAKAVKYVTVLTVSLGAALGAVFIYNKITAFTSAIFGTDAAMAALTGTTINYGLVSKLAWGGVATAIAAAAIMIYKIHDDSVNYYNELKEAADEAANRQIEANDKAQSAIRASYAETLKQEKERGLNALSFFVQAAQQRVAIEEKAYKRIGESAQNAFENAYGTARTLVDQLKERQRDAFKIADDFQKHGRQRITNDLQENLFRNRLTRNDAINGGDIHVERALYQKRLNQLNALIKDAAKRGDQGAATKFLDQKDSILNEMANKTVHNRFTGQTFVKYSGADEALKKNAEYRFQIEKQIAALKRGEATGLQEQINKEEDNLKALQDAYKEVYDFKLEDHGKPLFGSQEEALKSFDEKVEAAKKLTKDFAARAGNIDNGLVKDLFRRQSDLATGRGADLRATIVRRFREQSDLKAAKEEQEKYMKALGDDAQERINLLSAKHKEAADTLAKSQASRSVEVGNLFGRNVLDVENPFQRAFGRDINPADATNRFFNHPEATRRVELQNDIQTSLQGGQYDAALKKLKELRKLFEDNRALQTKIRGENGKQVTVDSSLEAIRKRITAERAAAIAEQDAGKKVKEAQTQQQGNANSLKNIQDRLNQLGPTSKEIVDKLVADQATYRKSLDETIRKLDEIIQKRASIGPNEAETAEQNYNQKTGQPVQYTTEDGTIIGSGQAVQKAQGGYMFPGGPSGTDTIPAWLTPGEYVMPKDKTAKYRQILERMRAGYFAGGGEIQIGGQTVTDALTGGLFAQVAKADTRNQEEMENKLQRLPWSHHHWRGGGGSVDYEPTDMGFADGGLVGDFTAQLKALNSGFGSNGSSGAGGDTTHVGDINITVNGGDTGRATVQQIGQELDRAIRRRAIKLRAN